MAGAENVEYPQIKTQTKRIRAFQFPVLWNMRLKKSLWIATNSWVSLILLLWLVSNGAGLSPSKTFIYHEKAHSKRRSKLFLSKRESISSDQEHIFKPVFPAAGCPKSLSCLQVPCDSRHSPGFLIPLPLSNTIQIPQLKFFPPSSSSSPFSTVSLLFSKDVRNCGMLIVSAQSPIRFLITQGCPEVVNVSVNQPFRAWNTV